MKINTMDDLYELLEYLSKNNYILREEDLKNILEFFVHQLGLEDYVSNIDISYDKKNSNKLGYYSFYNKKITINYNNIYNNIMRDYKYYDNLTLNERFIETILHELTHAYQYYIHDLHDKSYIDLVELSKYRLADSYIESGLQNHQYKVFKKNNRLYSYTFSPLEVSARRNARKTLLEEINKKLNINVNYANWYLLCELDDDLERCYTLHNGKLESPYTKYLREMEKYSRLEPIKVIKCSKLPADLRVDCGLDLSLKEYADLRTKYLDDINNYSIHR